MSSLGTSQWSRSTIQPMVKTLAKNLVSSNVCCDTQDSVNVIFALLLG